MDDDDHEASETGIVRDMISHAVSKEFTIFVGTHGINWYSKDCGKTIYSLNHGKPMENLKIHPVDPNFMLATAFSDCDEDEE